MKAIDRRIKTLEKMKTELWTDEPILIRVRDCSRGAKPIPVDRFDLSASSLKMNISRDPDESEEGFLDRVMETGREHLIKPRDRNDVPPAVMLLQRVDKSTNERPKAIERRHTTATS
jgi:hypothetical protein